MKRDIEDELLRWKNKSSHSPLILRGKTGWKKLRSRKIWKGNV